MPIKILPYIVKTEPNQNEKKEPEFISQIQKPKPKVNRQNGQRQIFFIK